MKLKPSSRCKTHMKGIVVMSCLSLERPHQLLMWNFQFVTTLWSRFHQVFPLINQHASAITAISLHNVPGIHLNAFFFFLFWSLKWSYRSAGVTNRCFLTLFFTLCHRSCCSLSSFNESLLLNGSRNKVTRLHVQAKCAICSLGPHRCRWGTRPQPKALAEDTPTNWKNTNDAVKKEAEQPNLHENKVVKNHPNRRSEVFLHQPFFLVLL